MLDKNKTHTIFVYMIEISPNSSTIDLIDTDNNNILYRIPLNRFTEESNRLNLCSEWIIHLMEKDFIKETSKSCLYELSVMMEKQKPAFFDWNKTFNAVENSIYSNTVFDHQNKKNEEGLEIIDFSMLEIDDLLFDDTSVKESIKIVVKENLAKYKL